MKDGTMDEMPVTIEGEACDSINAIASVTVNGTSVSLAGNADCKTFSAAVNSTWGLNIIDMVVENALGDEVPVVQSFLRSPEYFPAPGTADDARIAGAWRGRLGQEVLDDRDRGDLDDLASIVEIAINSFGFNEAIPVVLFNSVSTSTHDCILYTTTGKTGLRFERNGPLVLGEIQMHSILAAPGSIEIDFTIGKSTLPLSVRGYLTLPCVPEVRERTTGSVGFSSVRVRGTFNVELNDSENTINVTMASSTIDFTSPFVKVNLTGISQIDNLISNASTLVVSAFKNFISDSLVSALKGEIETAIEGFIDGFTVNPTVDVPAPVSVQLAVESTIDHVQIGNGFIDLGLSASVLPSVFKKTAEQLVYGSILGASTLPSFDAMDGTFGVGMKDDFINQVLWAVWAGGGFDLTDGNISLITDLMSSASLDASFVSVETGLPPVLMPGAEGSEVRIGIGDVLVKMKVNPSLLGQPGAGSQVELSFYVSLTLTGALEINPETREMNVILSGEPAVHVQLADHVRTEESGALESRIGNFTSDLIQRLVTDVIGAVELPSIPLIGIEGIPAGTKWVVDRGSMDHAAGYFRVIGEVGVE